MAATDFYRNYALCKLYYIYVLKRKLFKKVQRYAQKKQE